MWVHQTWLTKNNWWGQQHKDTWHPINIFPEIPLILTFSAVISWRRCYWSWNKLQVPFSFFSTFERIAKKILLAQIKANYSSGDDISSDDETQTQEDESESDGLKEVRHRIEDDPTDENGKSVSSK